MGPQPCVPTLQSWVEMKPRPQPTFSDSFVNAFHPATATSMDAHGIQVVRYSCVHAELKAKTQAACPHPMNSPHSLPLVQERSAKANLLAHDHPKKSKVTGSRREQNVCSTLPHVHTV